MFSLGVCDITFVLMPLKHSVLLHLVKKKTLYLQFSVLFKFEKKSLLA